MENYNPYEEPKGSILLGILGALRSRRNQRSSPRPMFLEF